ncbi:MAG TPA: DUF5985 family protein [Thermoanaerobaculia bacterium]|nr:DUF5985 family protein [Thermoanaerobaculia bacterium]
MIGLVSGMLVAGYLVAALFFARFWAQSRDRLFLLFTAAFSVLAIQRLALAVSSAPMEDRTLLYLLRFLAFAIILVAIIDKNRR